MTGMLDTIIPKSDQLNADDLIGGRTMTITITNVGIKMDEQPVSIHFDGDGGKPYKPGKSMRRVLVNVWGPDAKVYVGRKLTLYRDDNVKFGGMDVGGIRISHMSHIAAPVTMALTATKAQRRPFTVKPLAEPKPAEPSPKKKGLTQWFADLDAEFNEAGTDGERVLEIIERDETKRALENLKNGALEKLHALIKAYKPDWAPPGQPIENDPTLGQSDDIFPGDLPSKVA